ncbi:hypothetical protein CJ030_MR1G027431 [Morella rubra]|uniref:Uncharacterized protein n=1 Tax=Morella rubra TaxID=262757 RepID=A0A6A1WSL6_9ROSI|nr:hypothetical protein CJ030_MR1G027431 [Morella rubra]
MRGKQVEPMISEHLGLSGISLEKVVALSPDSIYGVVLHAALFEVAEHSPSKIRFKIVIDPCQRALTIKNPSDPLEDGFGENWAEEYTPFLRIQSWEKRAVAIKEKMQELDKFSWGRRREYHLKAGTTRLQLLQIDERRSSRTFKPTFVMRAGCVLRYRDTARLWRRSKFKRVLQEEKEKRRQSRVLLAELLVPTPSLLLTRQTA